MIIPLTLLAASLAGAQVPSPAPNDYVAYASVSALKERFVESTDEPARAKLLLRRLLYKRRPECELEEAAKQ